MHACLPSVGSSAVETGLSRGTLVGFPDRLPGKKQLYCVDFNDSQKRIQHLGEVGAKRRVPNIDTPGVHSISITSCNELCRSQRGRRAKEKRVCLLWVPCAAHPLIDQLVGEVQELGCRNRNQQEINLALCFCSFCSAQQTPRCG